ncbi:MAG: glycine dehydrogenase (aminomethyl-transferring), partial [Acidimicrobiales bacterium]
MSTHQPDAPVEAAGPASGAPLATLYDFEDPSPFLRRHIGPSEAEQAHMLEALGYKSLDDLLTAAIPDSIRNIGGGNISQAYTEEEVQDYLREIASRNRPMTQMIGMGYFDSVMPAVIRRNVLENPAWYTAYTPYQAEISQGRLEALLVFQTMVSDLTGLPVANASLLDEASAAAEAMIVCLRHAKYPGPEGHTFVVDADCLPQTLAVLRTRSEPLGIRLEVRDLTGGAVVGPGAPRPAPGLPDGPLAGVLLQCPGVSGAVSALAPLVASAHERGALAVVAADPLALCLLRSPGELGADVAIGTTQRFGVPLGFGGPHAAYIAVRHGLERSLPGRVVGVSRDSAGNEALRLAVQTREQHIRREKATSNICTAQVLLAVIAAMYAAYHGRDGLTAIARRVHGKAATLASALRQAGYETDCPAFFDTVRVTVPGSAAQIVARARAAGYNLHQAGPDAVQIACDETTTDEHLRAVVAAFAGPGSDEAVLPGDPVPGAPADDGALPAGLVRTSGFLTHPVFSAHRSETAMLRYLRQLADRDIALDRSMIPLGSCTMKLNAAAEMEAITWPQFAGLHPFAPAEQAAGYLELIGELTGWLAEL